MKRLGVGGIHCCNGYAIVRAGAHPQLRMGRDKAICRVGSICECKLKPFGIMKTVWCLRASVMYVCIRLYTARPFNVERSCIVYSYVDRKRTVLAVAYVQYKAV